MDHHDVNEFIASGTPTEELASIIANLAARGMGEFVTVDYKVIRGMAYYTGPVFEAFDCKSEFRATAGGGRYDNLFKLISGGKVNLPALGFGMGDVVLLELLKARGLLPKFDASVDVFVLIEDETLRPQSLALVQQLRAAGQAVEYALTPAKPDKQFKRAQELNATQTARIAEGSTVRIRNLNTREEVSTTLADVAEIGSTLAAEQEAAVVESVKAAADVYAPIAGTGVEGNQAVVDTPEAVNQDAYAAWLFRIRPAAAADLTTLLDADAYQQIVDAA